jgi:hypothetical protein
MILVFGQTKEGPLAKTPQGMNGTALEEELAENRML